MIDSHCHLDHEPLISNLDQILDRARKLVLIKYLPYAQLLIVLLRLKKLSKKIK